jgi:hypothetical protein
MAWKWFYRVFQGWFFDFLKNFAVRFILAWNSLNKNFESKFLLRVLWTVGKNRKFAIYSVLFDKFHRWTNLLALCWVNWGFKRELCNQSIEILSPKRTSHTNFGSELGNESVMLFKHFQSWSNLMAVLFGNLGEVLIEKRLFLLFLWRNHPISLWDKSWGCSMWWKA